MYNIRKVLEGADSNGFTIALKGETRRYVIGLTHNEDNVNIEKLEEQVYSNESLDNVNVWGWINEDTHTKYIDISTSVDSLTFAQQLGKFYNQIAIWDRIAQKEIRL